MITIRKDDELYPKKLKEISNPPEQIYANGNLDILNNKSIAVVGSRNMSSYGEKITKQIVRDLALSGLCIVSGMAVGIDAVAHRTCLENGGKTIAVLGSGLKRIFPPENKDLYKKIVQNDGCVISEYEADASAQKRFFVQRNRIVSGLADATLVIEATYRSGTSITAKYALAQGKKLFCIPNSIGNKNSAGILNWIKRGAKVVTCAEDILKELNMDSIINEENEAKRQHKRMEEIEQACLEGIEEDAVKIYEYIKENKVANIECISKELEVPIEECNYYLSMLELKGLVANYRGLDYRLGDSVYEQ